MNDSADYKARIYESYYETHILPRKGPVTHKQLKGALKVFDLHFASFLPDNPQAEAVDLGCGSGKLVYWLHERGLTRARGVDGSAGQIAAGQALGIDNLYVADLSEYLADVATTFDVIFMRDVLEHLQKREVLPTLDLCQRALKPGGRLVVQVPNGASPMVGRVLYGDFTHEVAYTETSLSQLFLLAGFDDCQFRPFLPYITPLRWRSVLSPTGRKAIRRWLAWKSAEKLYEFLIYAEVGKGSTITTFNLIAAATKPSIDGPKDEASATMRPAQQR